MGFDSKVAPEHRGTADFYERRRNLQQLRFHFIIGLGLARVWARFSRALRAAS
jgi:hypothetical protein